MTAVRFLHTGDLHLDSPFTGLSASAPEHVAAALRDATIGAWRAIVELAVEERLDFVLVAGDVFDRGEWSLRAQVGFRDGLVRLSEAGIPTLVVAGNHDPLPSWERAIRISWPPLAHLFGADEVAAKSIRRAADGSGARLAGQDDGSGPGSEIARVHGISFGRGDVGENLARRFRREPGEQLAIGLLHANVGSNTGHEPYAPCSVEDLRRSGMDYWALGHVHRRGVVSSSDPVAVYAGNPQGRDPNESDPRGCYLVTASPDGSVATEFRPVDVVRWQHLRVDASDLDGVEPLIERVVAAVDAARVGAGRSIVARVEVTGRGPIHSDLARAGVPGEIGAEAQARLGTGSPWAWIESVRDHTGSSIDVEARAGAPDFLGEVLREIRRVREGLAIPPEGQENAARLAAALDELYGHGRARRHLGSGGTDAECLMAGLDEAERLLLDRLEPAS